MKSHGLVGAWLAREGPRSGPKSIQHEIWA